MEGHGEKRLENALSQKALQMSTSNSCKIWIIGFICGICFTYVFVLVFSPLWPNLPLSFYFNSPTAIFKNSSLPHAGIVENSANRNTITIQEKDESSIVSLDKTWSLLIDKNSNHEAQIPAAVPRAPHLEDCEKNTQRNKRVDNRAENGSLPDWTIWKGYMARVLHEEQIDLRPITPWVYINVSNF